MRLFISADLEGVAGVVSKEYLSPKGNEYRRARELMTGEVNAAIEGALQAGVEEILVADSHGNMCNLIPEKLNSRARLISGSSRPLGMMEGVAANFSAVFFIGYHSRAGTQASVLAHTYSGQAVYRLKINGSEQGELGLNSFLAGYYALPVVLVTGDLGLMDEVQDLLGAVETAAVKEGRGRFSASSLHPEKARELVRDSALRAIERLDSFQPLAPAGEQRMELLFPCSGMADMAALTPGSGRIGPREVSFVTDDYLELYSAFRVMVGLAHLSG